MTSQPAVYYRTMSAYSTMSGHNFISAPCLRTFTPERHLLPPPANKDDFEKGNDDDPKDDPVVQ